MLNTNPRFEIKLWCTFNLIYRLWRREAELSHRRGGEPPMEGLATSGRLCTNCRCDRKRGKKRTVVLIKRPVDNDVFLNFHNARSFAKPNEFGERFSASFFHDTTAMHFDGVFGDVQPPGDLLVQHTRNN